MNNTELRAAIEQTAERMHFFAMKVKPSDVELATKPFRDHLAALMAEELRRAKKEEQ